MSDQFSIISTAILLFFILDPLGSIPVLLTLLKDIDSRQRYSIIIRELLIGLGILLLFLFFGKDFLELFDLETESVTIAGGIIFFVIGIKMIFPVQNAPLFSSETEPLVVPIAMPMIAGPSALATLIVLNSNNEGRQAELLYALLLAWVATAFIFLIAPSLFRVLRKKGLMALERLMGMLLLIMAVQMFINGLREIF